MISASLKNRTTGVASIDISYPRLFALLILFGLTAPLHAQDTPTDPSTAYPAADGWLITSPAQLSTNASQLEMDGIPGHGTESYKQHKTLSSLLDGDASTFYDSEWYTKTEGKNHYLEVGLTKNSLQIEDGKTIILYTKKYTGYQNDEAVSQFKLEYSKDGVSWTACDRPVDIVYDGNNDSKSFLPYEIEGSTRLRFTVEKGGKKGNGDGYCFGLTEFNLRIVERPVAYSSENGWLITSVSQLTSNTTEEAQGAPSPSTPGYARYKSFLNLLDGDAYSFFDSGWNTDTNGDKHYLAVSFESSLEIADNEIIQLYTRKADGSVPAVNFRLEYSEDGSNWTECPSPVYISYDGNNESRSILPSEVNGSTYLRFTLEEGGNTSASGANSFQLAEFNLRKVGVTYHPKDGWLVSTADQLSTNADANMGNIQVANPTGYKEHKSLSNLLDEDANTYFDSEWYTNTGAENHYIEVTLGNPLNIADGKSVILYTKRRGGYGDVSQFILEYTKDGVIWTRCTRLLDIAYDGNNDSHTFLPYEIKGCTGLRFTVADGGKESNNGGAKCFGLAEFNLRTVEISSSYSASEGWLITSQDMIYTNASGNNPDRDGIYFLDGNAGSYWESEQSDEKQQYIIVDFGEKGFSTGENEDMVVFLQRYNPGTKAHPTTFRIEGSNSKGTDASWSPVAHAYFLYRGPQTKEYSERIHFTGSYRYLRFTVTANNSRSRNGDIRWMRIGEFNILKIAKGAPYPGGLKDRLHLETDYVKRYVDYDFVHTLGAIDKRNHVNWHGNYAWKTIFGGESDDTTPESKSFVWNYKAEELTKANIPLPEFKYITPNNDPDGIVKEGVRQDTHVTEHILYAVRGDAVALYPYYDLPISGNYYENFSHWYDYTTGKGNKYLDFLIDPSYVMPIKTTGGNEFIAGTGVPFTDAGNVGNRRYYGTVATFFKPRDIYAKDGVTKGLFEDENNVTEYVIAADFSQRFDSTNDRNIVDNDNKIYEPVINFRHIFRIKDGKQFAEDNMSTKERNDAYLKKNRRHVSARAGVDFQIRFDCPVPAEGTTRSKWYYKANDAGTDYRRVCSQDIVVYNLATGDEVEKMFYPGEEFNGQGTRVIDGVSYYLCGGGGKYYRMLKCNGDKAVQGSYLVRLIAKDVNGNRIKVKDAAGKEHDLAVQEYQIDFNGESQASFLNENQLNTDKYRSRRPSELTRRMGAPKNHIDYDEYAEIFKIAEGKGGNGKAEDIIKYFLQDNGKKPDGSSAYFLKYPLPSRSVTYANDYFQTHDFNMYMVCDHSNATSHHSANPNLFDRSYYDNGQDIDKRGFFFYVNAATDPGNMAYLAIPKFCAGTTIYVSAWVAEFTASNEWANVAFNFYAIMKSGGRVPIHTFVTGYIPDNARWHQVYYSFVPHLDGVNVEDVEKYELVLENNCKSSQGADYAIDDISVYMSQPEVYARQTKLLCEESDLKDGETAKSIPVKIYAPYDVLMGSLGMIEPTKNEDGTINYVETPETQNLYYVFLNKEKYDGYLTAPEHKNEENLVANAFNYALVKFAYRGGAADSFGKVSFKTFYNHNKEYKNRPANSFTDEEAYRELDGIERFICFDAKPEDNGMKLGTEYYLYLYMPQYKDSQASQSPGHSDFIKGAGCDQYCVLRVQGANQIKIDGVVQTSEDEMVVCPNQSPVVQVDLMGIPDAGTGGGGETDGKETGSGTAEVIEYNAFFDWYLGTLSEYNEEGPTKVDENGNPVTGEDGKPLKDFTLAQALINMRAVPGNEYETDIDKIRIEGEFTQPMHDFLRELIYPSDQEVAPKLKLGGHSFAFPIVTLEEGETEKYVYVVATPVADEVKGYTICTSPAEVRLKVRNKSPKLLHGLASGLTYPESLSDVPLRIGYRQIRRVSVDSESAGGDAGNGNSLVIPVRHVSVASQNASAIGIGTDSYVYLAETDDPYYKNIQGPDDVEGPLLPVGIVGDIVADTSGPDKNHIKVNFFNDFLAKEGYTYRLRYNYAEKGADVSEIDEEGAEEETPEEILCDGQDVFTIKVVPEYQAWTGDAGNTDWNNDRNWKRVTRGDILNTRQNDDYFFIETNNNANARSFVPLDFTKVVIPRPGETVSATAGTEGSGETSVKVPYLRGFSEVDDPATLSFSYDKALENRKFVWSATPKEDATHWIEYDMASVDADNTNGVRSGDVLCRPWLAQECEQIHFNAGSWIGAQQYLRYEKAWVDMEMSPSRWYTVSSPLRATLAGDMYAPSANARQNTELFQPISFNKGTNNRFKPAVYQRGWDKGSETVYELPSESAGPTRKVAVAANWSHVYNDVAEVYIPGSGYSVKTDVSRLGTDFDKERDFVKFRFPKADEKYLYQEDGKDPAGEENGAIETLRQGAIAAVPGRDGTAAGAKVNVSGRLIDWENLNGGTGSTAYTVTLNRINAGKFFLAGNPFMNYLSMAKFLEGNKNEIAPKYWIMTGDSQLLAVMDENDENGFVGVSTESGNSVNYDDAATFKYVAPMQGFFVEATKDEETLELTFTPDMMAKADDILGTGGAAGSVTLPRPWIKSPSPATRAADDGSADDGSADKAYELPSDRILITTGESAAIVRVKGAASRGYDAQEDMLWIDDSNLRGTSRVYTIAGNMAATINQTPSADGVEVGVSAPSAETVTTLRFEGEMLDGLKLLDTATGESSDLYSGFTKSVEGSVSGRLFISGSSDVKSVADEAISITSEGEDVVVRSPEVCGIMTVRVFDTAGRTVAVTESGDDEIRISLPKGVYVVEARGSESGRKVAKVKI